MAAGEAWIFDSWRVHNVVNPRTDPRIHLVGYGPSASTIGANRAGFTAARSLRDLLKEQAA